MLAIEFDKEEFYLLFYVMSMWMTPNQLNGSNTGCLVGNSIVSHLMYADDLVLLSPYSAGLQQMLKVCSQYGTDHDIKYNAKKSHVMIVRSTGERKSIFPTFHLSDSPLDVCEEIKNLGRVISDDWMDDKDIYRQLCKIHSQTNTLIRKFSMCSDSNDAMRLLHRVPRWQSASQLFVSTSVPTCEALLRQLMFSFMRRLDKSENHILEALVSPLKSSYRFTSKLRRHWYNSLYII